MNAKIKYTDEPLGKTKVVPDLLLSSSELAFREESVKVTLALSKKSIEFFKSEATKHHTQYQRMIRRLLDSYVDAHALTPALRRGAPKAARPLARQASSFFGRMLPATSSYLNSRHSIAPLNSGVLRDGFSRMSFGRRRSPVRMYAVQPL